MTEVACSISDGGKIPPAARNGLRIPNAVGAQHSASCFLEASQPTDNQRSSACRGGCVALFSDTFIGNVPALLYSRYIAAFCDLVS